MEPSPPSPPPPDPKDLKSEAITYEYSSKVPLKVWLRTASRIVQHARAYAEQQVIDEAFVLYLRFVDLFSNHLYRHPELVRVKKAYQRDRSSKEAQQYREYLSLRAKIPQLMTETEQFNALLEERFQRHVEEARQVAEALRRSKEEQIAKQRAIEQRRIALNKGEPVGESSVSDTELTERLSLLLKKQPPPLPPPPQPRQQQLKKQPQQAPVQAMFPSPPKEETSALPFAPPYAPPSAPPSYVATPSAAGPPAAPLPPTATTNITHHAGGHTEGGTALRSLFLPKQLIDDFLGIAEPNTSKGLETCGLLCGKLNRNAFFVTYLVIPEQDSTPNTCSTKNEEGLFETIDELDLFVLGWIHTHPTQSCFLSSIDLHTQNSYQIMLNEAIAVVCSPSPKFDKHLGIFRLTDPPGLKIITNCGKSGFHPHPQKNIYTECNKGKDNPLKGAGHVSLKDLPYTIKDLRK